VYRTATDLIPEQRAIVEAQDGPALVLASVGCGKTRVLAHRAALALDRGLPPASLLAITFTNRAAREMRDRLYDLVGTPARDATVGTFHGFCAHVLRQSGKPLGFEPNFTVWDEVDCREAVRLAIKALGFAPNDESVKAMHGTISASKMGCVYPQNWPGGRDTREYKVFREYQRILQTSNALDFDDLVVQTWTLFRHFPAICDEWSQRFCWVETDEFQDTLDLEYDLLNLLTAGHRNVCVFGDPEQWIYRWRGVDAQKVIGRFRSDFPEHQALALSQNFRSTATILRASRAIVASGTIDARHTVAPGEIAGDPIRVHACATEADESAYIARRIAEVHRRGTSFGATAVLTRTNVQVARVAQALIAADIPYVTVATTDFLRRPEIKDLAAYLRLIVDPFDTQDLIALRRVANVPDRGLPAALLDQVERAGRSGGLLLTDLVGTAGLEDEDPCAYELAVADRDYVAIDVEATGLDLAADEIVTLAAVKVSPQRGTVEELDLRLRPGRPVGASERIHGYSDTYLAEHGAPPREALASFRDFIGSLPLVGHNIRSYDLPLIDRNLIRVGLPPLRNRIVDTLGLARRLYTLDRYDLNRVRAACGVENSSEHHALEDARCAQECFVVLAHGLAETAEHRRRIIGEMRGRFLPLAQLISRWRERAYTSELSELVEQILTESGYLAHLRHDRVEGPRRVRNLEQLRALIEERFDRLPADRALPAFVEYLSLARAADTIEREDDRVRVLTVHSAKGLEFDAVFIAGVHDSGIPIHGSIRVPQELEEERRLLYVGMTRAKQLLEITYPLTNENRYGRRFQNAPSRFLADAPDGTMIYSAV